MSNKLSGKQKIENTVKRKYLMDVARSVLRN